MKGDIQCNNNSIYGIEYVKKDRSAVNRKYVNNELKKKLDKNKDINMRGNNITSDFNELLTKSYVDRKLSQAGGSVDLSPYLKKDGSVSMIGNLDIGDNKITNVGGPQNNKDAINLGFFNVELASKPITNTVLLRDGTQEMTNNLNMSNNKIIHKVKYDRPGGCSPEKDCLR